MPNLHKHTVHWFWQPSLRLAWLKLVVISLGCLAVLLSATPVWLKISVGLLLLLHATYLGVQTLRRDQPANRGGIRYTAQGWQLWSAQQGWRSVQLDASSMAIPALVLLRYKTPQQYVYRSVVIAADCLTADQHRQLRVRLKFSRQRWRAAI
ncbi:MAG TPA: protein YgfX [Thiopseudomonas sp.]|nr:protein YgfX [Thiopseudomonas sp.]